MSKINFIACTQWVRRGVAKEVPEQVLLTKDDLKRIIDQHQQNADTDENDQMSVEDSDQEVENNENDQHIIDKYDLDNYDNDSEGELGTTSLNSLATLTVFASEEDDPYLQGDDDNNEEEDETEDFRIKQTDNLLLVGHVESDASVLEVHVYSEEEDQYVHHDIILGAYPICIEPINFSASCDQIVNHIGIGDMTPDISIWDIDTVNCLEPVSKLSGHEDAVLDLSWNSTLRKVLCSGSADHSCCIWDLEKSKLLSQWKHFKCNVQSVEFHPFEAQTLLIGYANGNASLVDCQSEAFKKFKVSKNEIEKAIWNHFIPFQFLCATSDGHVIAFDVRNEQKPVYSIRAHNESITGLALSSKCNGCLITASMDKVVKIWDIGEKSAHFVTEYNDLNVGAILSLTANPDLPFIIAVGGDNNKSENFKIIDISQTKLVSTHFGQRVSETLNKNNINSDNKDKD